MLNELGERLLDAADIGRLADVESILSSQPDLVHYKNCYRYTALHTAAWNGHLEVCRVLIQKGSSVNTKNETQHTPLHLAAAKGHADVCQLLIEYGADCELVNKNGETALDAAKKWRRQDCVDVLERALNRPTKDWEREEWGDIKDKDSGESLRNQSRLINTLLNELREEKHKNQLLQRKLAEAETGLKEIFTIMEMERNNLASRVKYSYELEEKLNYLQGNLDLNQLNLQQLKKLDEETTEIHRRIHKFYLQKLENLAVQGQSEKICVVCLDNTVEVVYIPCGHAVVCTECAYRIGVGECCPTCREVIADVLKIFL